MANVDLGDLINRLRKLLHACHRVAPPGGLEYKKGRGARHLA